MTWNVSLENIAGIRAATETIEPGINVIRASNWQGKSSFLAGIETVCGTVMRLTEGHDNGKVRLETDEETVTVRLERTDGAVVRHGTPYLEDEYDRICADLFAFLDEDNEIRRAVRDGADLEPLLTRPLDFEDIDEQIAQLQSERGEVSTELQRANAAADRLPDLQGAVSELEAELSDLRAERESLSAADADSDDRKELADRRAERTKVKRRVDRLSETVERVNDRLDETRTELADLDVPEDTDVEGDIEQVREQVRTVERDRELLQGVFEANKRVLDEGRPELLTDVSRDIVADTVDCWLCGSETTTDEMEQRLSTLDERIGDLRTKAERYRSRLEELEERRETVRDARRRRDDLEAQVEELESTVEEKTAALEDARERLTELQTEIETLAADTETTADRLTDVESEIKYTEAELEDAREELSAAEAEAERRETLEAEYEALTDEIAELRNRKAAVKRQLRDSFSATLSDLLERFDTGFEMARLTGSFELIVARDGRETRLDELSEGERELVGFVVALAGHEAFDVGERVPVLLLDGLGALASENLRSFVDYTADRTEYLVLTAYPEHGRFDGNELSPAEWDVVSHQSEAEA